MTRSVVDGARECHSDLKPLSRRTLIRAGAAVRGQRQAVTVMPRLFC